MKKLVLLTPLFFSQLAVIKPQATVWLRLDETVEAMQIDPHGRFLAYQPQDGLGLKVLNLKSKYVYAVSKRRVGGSFFWAPGGHRLFYRELYIDAKKDIASEIKVFDISQRKSHLLESFASSSGFLTFDPRDLTFQVMFDKGIKVKKIYYPNNRLAKWQVGRRTQGEKWVVTQKGVMLVKDGGKSFVKLNDDSSGIASFSIAPKGETILWSTNNGNIYSHREREKVKFVDRGHDPIWHPEGESFVYAKAIYIGRKLVDYDLRFTDNRGYGRFLTRTRFSRERYPVWRKDGKQILFTREKTMDIFALDLVVSSPAHQGSLAIK